MFNPVGMRFPLIAAEEDWCRQGPPKHIEAFKVFCMESRSHSGLGIIRLTALVGVLSSLSLLGCAHHSTVDPKTIAASTSEAIAEAVPPPTHYSRYTLVEMSPDAAQTDLLQQVVDVRIPATATSSVGDTLRYVLLHSGYRLCEDPAIRDFDSFPLPAAHMHLGPLPLATVLQLLVGRSWALEIDEGHRRVCFSHEDTSSLDRETHHTEHRPEVDKGNSGVLATGEPE